MENNRFLSASVAADEFDDEESKMEKFYELIRRFNEARARHQSNQQERQETILRRINQNSNRGDQKKDVKSENGAALIPSFKWEDFRDLYHPEDEGQVSGINFLQHAASNFTNSDKIVDTYTKKRKINEIEVDDDNDNGDYDEIPTADQLKYSRSQFETGLDLNLAL